MLSSRSAPAVPVITVQSGLPGPRVLITAGVHGDECVGVGVIFSLMEVLKSELCAGLVFLAPSLNPEGLRRGTRCLPGDERDLNRLFPGDSRGGLADRHAAAVWEELRDRRPDALIDLHTDSCASIPYALVDRCVRPRADANAIEARAWALAEASGFTALAEYPPDLYRRYQLDRSLTGAMMNLLGVPTVTLECGPRRLLDPAAVEEATVATLGAVTALGVCRRPAPRHQSHLGPGRWRRDAGPRCAAAGVLRPLVAPGGRFAAGDALAELRGLEGQRVERLRAAESGVVIALPERGWVEEGAVVATVAIPTR